MAQLDEPCPHRLLLCLEGPQSGQAPGTRELISVMKKVTITNIFGIGNIAIGVSVQIYETRSLGGPTPSWRPFGPLNFVPSSL